MRRGGVSLHWSGWESRPPTAKLPSFANKSYTFAECKGLLAGRRIERVKDVGDSKFYVGDNECRFATEISQILSNLSIFI